jgi:ribosomal protein S18 acetylase RimI-like enzyme
LIIRRGAPDDAAALAAFAVRTFTDTYSEFNRPEDLRAHLDAAFGVAQQTAELTDPGAITLIAESPEGFVGYAQLRRGPTPKCLTVDDPVEVQRFYVDRPAHGTGVAARLMAEVHRAARELGGRHVWLGVWEHNPRAIAFYRKAGFVDVGTHDFHVGPDRQTDRVVVMPIRTDDLP